MQYHIGQQMYGSVEMLLQEDGVIDGLLLACIGIEVSSHRLHSGRYLPGGEAGSPLEAHVFGKVCHAALLLSLVACTGIHGYACIDDLCGTLCADDAYSACKGVGIVCLALCGFLFLSHSL